MATNKLGRQGRDKITGFEGAITGHCTYLTGCSQLLIAPKARDGALVASEWIDEQRVEILDGDAIVLDNGPTPGFDKSPPRR